MARVSILCADSDAQHERDWLAKLRMAEPRRHHVDVDDNTISPEATEASIDSNDSSDQRRPLFPLPVKDGSHSSHNGMANRYESSISVTLSLAVIKAETARYDT